MSMTNKCKVICINKYNLPDSRYYFEKGKLYNLIVWEYKDDNKIVIIKKYLIYHPLLLIAFILSKI